MRFKVTIAETAYTDYFVEAKSSDEARTLVGDQSFRAKSEEWAESGYGDDPEIVACERVDS